MNNPIKRFLQKVFVTTEKEYLEKYLPQTMSGKQFNPENAESIAVVFTCIKLLSETVSRLPLNVYNDSDSLGRIVDKADYRYDLLHYNPNNYTTSQNFFNALEYTRNLTGNAFALIHRDINGKPISLELLNPSLISGWKIVNNELYYIINKDEKVNSNDILHFRMVTKDGIWGINPIEILRMNLSTTFKGYSTIDNYYDNNITAPKYLKSNAAGANQKALNEAMTEFAEKYASHINAGKMPVAPAGTEIAELSMNYADAQLIETMKFNASQISALYGVPPHLIGLYEASKFNNVEQLQINYKVNTIAPILRMYRQELEFKLLTSEERKAGKTIEFNSMALVETDQTTRIQGYKDLYGIGVMTPNQIARLEGYDTYEGGDSHFMMQNFTTVEGFTKKQDEEFKAFLANLNAKSKPSSQPTN